MIEIITFTYSIFVCALLFLVIRKWNKRKKIKKTKFKLHNGGKD